MLTACFFSFGSFAKPPVSRRKGARSAVASRERKEACLDGGQACGSRKRRVEQHRPRSIAELESVKSVWSIPIQADTFSVNAQTHEPKAWKRASPADGRDRERDRRPSFCVGRCPMQTHARHLCVGSGPLSLSTAVFAQYERASC